MVRTWNPFIPGKANAVLSGHRSTICALVVIDAGNRIYSLSKDRCIKVWDVPVLSCIQVWKITMILLLLHVLFRSLPLSFNK